MSPRGEINLIAILAPTIIVSVITFVLGTAIGGSCVLSQHERYATEVEQQINWRDRTLEALDPESVKVHLAERATRVQLKPR